MNSETPSDVWKLRIPQEIAVQIELVLMDPATQKPRYGAKSLLVSQLLQRYIRETGLNLKSLPLTDQDIELIQ